jgi:chromate reductase, NAD(P)H dehydrogenase (quinone)
MQPRNHLETSGTLRVLGIAGSLRKASFNRRLLNAAVELAPEALSIDVFDLSGIPLYNGDLDTDALRPSPVVRLKEAIRQADGVLFVTPEYNHSVPGVLQNAIDWASRPGGKSVLAGKPVALMGASTGAVGTARAQQQLKLVLLSTLAHVMPHPGVVVAQAAARFDGQGRLTDEPTRTFVAKFLKDFEHWISRVAEPAPEHVL